ncbi:MAG: FlgD immunoglobulin-like domain containing protein [bacterium]
MKKRILILQIVVVLVAATIASAQIDWRFGLEWNEVTLLGWSDPILEQLLGKLQNLGTGGAINVNAHGSWGAMQSSPNAAIDWAQNDAIVKLFQRYGFSLTWYVTCSAPWAFPNKPDCQPDTILGVVVYRNCAPEPAFESHWINYIKAVVERYDGDGIDDMPGLEKSVQFYILPGEIKFGMTGTGDEELGPFWFDNIDNLLRLHRITYQAIHEADPTGNLKVVSSGALLWDLYADFPDYPAIDPSDPNSTIRKRLGGENFKGSTYTAGWDSLKKMLDSFGNDADGIECDYIGWHPHFSWRVIDQEFAFIHAHAGNKPIYVDDMWTNIFAQGYFAPPIGGIPGASQFNAPANAFAGTEWVKRINGDFPNSLFPGLDPHATLFQKLNQNDQVAVDWYYANGARRLVKSFVSAFGEGAERVSFSGSNDLPRNLLIPNSRGWPGGWINLLGTRNENYAEKPQYYTYQLLIEKLHDFTGVEEIEVSNSPLTRVYAFDRPRGPVYVAWSETGEAPPELNYRNPSGETVILRAKNNVPAIKLTHIITDTANTAPEEEMIPTQQGVLTIQLGYEPIFLEGDFLTDVAANLPSRPPVTFELEQNYPNPFNPSTTIRFNLSKTVQATLTIYNTLGQVVRTLCDQRFAAGQHQVVWDGLDNDGRKVASGLYLLRMAASREGTRPEVVQVRKMLLMQ